MVNFSLDKDKKLSISPNTTLIDDSILGDEEVGIAPEEEEEVILPNERKHKLNITKISPDKVPYKEGDEQNAVAINIEYKASPVVEEAVIIEEKEKVNKQEKNQSTGVSMQSKNKRSVTIDAELAKVIEGSVPVWDTIAEVVIKEGKGVEGDRKKIIDQIRGGLEKKKLKTPDELLES